MNDPQKGFIAPLLLALVAILLIGGGAYVYVQNKQANQTTIANSVLVSQNSTGKILLGDKALYENLSVEEKAIVGGYHTDLMRKLNDEIKKEGLDPATYEGDQPINGCTLKYYDATKALIGCAVPKPGLPLYLVDRNTWKDVGEYSGRLNSWDGYLETKNYIISVSDSGIYYYKSGDTEVRLIPNSIKPHTQKALKVPEIVTPNAEPQTLGPRPEPVEPTYEETYVQNYGMAYSYDISFDEPTKKLSVGVFKPAAVQKYIDATELIKIRTVEFVLP